MNLFQEIEVLNLIYHCGRILGSANERCYDLAALAERELLKLGREPSEIEDKLARYDLSDKTRVIAEKLILEAGAFRENAVSCCISP